MSWLKKMRGGSKDEPPQTLNNVMDSLRAKYGSLDEVIAQNRAIQRDLILDRPPEVVDNAITEAQARAQKILSDAVGSGSLHSASDMDLEMLAHILPEYFLAQIFEEKGHAPKKGRGRLE